MLRPHNLLNNGTTTTLQHEWHDKFCDPDLEEHQFIMCQGARANMEGDKMVLGNKLAQCRVETDRMHQLAKTGTGALRSRRSLPDDPGHESKAKTKKQVVADFEHDSQILLLGKKKLKDVAFKAFSKGFAPGDKVAGDDKHGGAVRLKKIREIKPAYAFQPVGEKAPFAEKKKALEKKKKALLENSKAEKKKKKW